MELTKTPFNAFWDRDAVDEAVKLGTDVFAGFMSICDAATHKGMVIAGPKNIVWVDSKASINRCMSGDKVAVKLLPSSGKRKQGVVIYNFSHDEVRVFKGRVLSLRDTKAEFVPFEVKLDNDDESEQFPIFILAKNVPKDQKRFHVEFVHWDVNTKWPMGKFVVHTKDLDDEDEDDEGDEDEGDEDEEEKPKPAERPKEGLTPYFHWAQDKQNIYLTFELRSVEGAKFALKQKQFEFSGTSDKKFYSVCVELGNPVAAEGSLHVVKARVVEVILAKQNQDADYWGSMLGGDCKKKFKAHCKVDWNLWRDEDDDDDSPLKGIDSFCNGGAAFEDDDEGDDDDDDGPPALD